MTGGADYPLSRVQTVRPFLSEPSMKTPILASLFRLIGIALGVCSFGMQPLDAATDARLLVISVDGLRPDYVTAADRHGYKIPALRKLLAEGAHAEGVIGVVPTITYPSHATLMTGVWPIEHGVFGNQQFDPFAPGTTQITEISTIKVPTLWEVAHKAGYTVANVGWPVTTGAKFIDWLLPANAAFERDDPDGATATQSAANIVYDNPPGLGNELADSLPKGKKLGVSDRRHEWQVAVIKRFKPHFMTAHVGHLDATQHRNGPFTPAVKTTIEYVDGLVGRLVATQRAAHPDSYIAIVSDHGFLPTERGMSVNALLARAGLLDVENKRWEAAAYDTGGSSAIMVRDPRNATILAKVKEVIAAAAKNPDYGIGRVFTREEVVARGGHPEAVLMLDAAPGWRFVGGTRQVVLAVPGTGAHGQFPDQSDLRATFIIAGPGVDVGRNLGVIDMRQIGPTLAKVLGLTLPAARMQPVNYAP